MAPKTDNVLPEPRPGFERINYEFSKLVEDRTNGQPYQGGAYLAPSDIANMKVVFDLNAKTGFWAPAGDNRRCALEEIFSGLETLLNDGKQYKENSPNAIVRRCQMHTVQVSNTAEHYSI